METKNIDLSKLSSEELKKLLEKKEQEERNAYKKKKAEYEKNRDALVIGLFNSAKKLHEEMKSVKRMMITKLIGFKEYAKEYADIRSNSKGGFSLRSADGTKKVVYERNVKNEYDERAKEAETLIKEFLADKVRKRDEASYKLITGLMQKNLSGDYSPALIAKLLKHEDDFNDERWSKAMKLFKESYNEVEVSYSVSFYEKDGLGKDRHISLTFSSIPVEE